MPIFALEGKSPSFADRASVWIAPDASVIGEIVIGKDVGIWFGAVLRGDIEPISIGDRTNLQEHVILHTDAGYPLAIGQGCTIGHRALVHGCTIGDNTLVGMGSIILNGAKVGSNCLVGAGALLTEGKEFPDGSLIVGSPARVIRQLDAAAINRLKMSAAQYAANAKRFMTGLSVAAN